MVQNIEAKQFPNEGQQHIENVRITQPQQREIPCINDITHDRADWHKELLFGLFLSCDEKELQSLKSKAGANFGVASARPNSRKIFKESLSSVENSHLTIIPEVLRTYDGAKNATPLAPPLLNSSFKRKDHDSTSIEAMQKSIYSKLSHPNLTSKTKKAEIPMTTSVSSILQKLPARLRGPYKKKDQSLKESVFKRRKNSGPLTSKFEPVPLMFNECSLSTIARWAVGLTNDKYVGANHKGLFEQKVVESPFRKCSICDKWGHLEVECEELTQRHVVQLAPDIALQQILRLRSEEEIMSYESLSASRRMEHWNIHQTKSHDKRPRDNIGEIVGGIDSWSCTVCRSPHNAEDLLMCDGCDSMYHIKCLYPPLDNVPDGDWFCDSCSGYASDVSSVVEIEPCDGFLIEQRKRSTVSDPDETFKGCPQVLHQSFSSVVGVKKRVDDPKYVSRRFRDERYEKSLMVSNILLDQPDALSITGFASKKEGPYNEAVLGVYPRSDGALPLFAYPAVRCCKCGGHFPTHMLTELFYPPIDLPGKEIDLSLPPNDESGRNLPPPWGFFEMPYECGHCCRVQLNGIDGTVNFRQKSSLAWDDIILIALLNLMLLANPTMISERLVPKIFRQKKGIFNDKSKFYRFFDLEEICMFIRPRWSYFVRRCAVPPSSAWKEEVGKELQKMLERQELELKDWGGDPHFAVTQSLGFSRVREFVARIGVPTHIYTIMGTSMKALSVRSLTIVRNNPRTAILRPKMQMKVAPSEPQKKSSRTRDAVTEVVAPSGWESADADEFNGIIVLSKSDNENVSLKSRYSTAASSRHGSREQGNNECEIQAVNEENLEALALPKQIQNSIVAWNSHESSNITAHTKGGLTLGKVVAVDLSKGKALVSILPLTLKELEKLNPGNNEQVRLKFCKQGASQWVPFDKLLHVSEGPSANDQKVVSKYTVANVNERKEMRVRAVRAATAQRRKRDRKQGKKNASPKGKRARRTLSG